MEVLNHQERGFPGLGVGEAKLQVGEFPESGEVGVVEKEGELKAQVADETYWDLSVNKLEWVKLL